MKRAAQNPVSNAQIATSLRQYATALGLQRADRFKVAAFRRAAETIDRLAEDLAARVRRNEPLQGLPGIGSGISKVIEEIVRTGRLKALDDLQRGMSPESLEISQRPLLDPKKVMTAYRQLEIRSLNELRQSLENGSARKKLKANLILHLQQGLSDKRRLLWWEAQKLAVEIERFLGKVPGVSRVAAVGSLRRKAETVGDLNFLVTGKSAAGVFRGFESFGSVTRLQSEDRRSARFRTSSNVVIALIWAAAKDWGARLIETTGSSAHVAALAEEAGKTTRRKSNSRRKPDEAPDDEVTVYHHLGMQWIPPELRENAGEILAARQNKLPDLVQESDIRGDLHMHTTASDGANSLEEMVEACRARGYEYLAITEHSQSLKIANGLSERDVMAHLRKIDRLNERSAGFRVLKSAEVDILEDGSLDYPNRILKHLDLVICSIHSRFVLDRRHQTDRILRAIDNPYFTILGHATGRKLLRREGYEIDANKVLRRIRDRGRFAEINANPNRLDLSAENARTAKELGIKIAINTDAHSIHELRFITAGINQARRAWLTKADVLNCLPLGELLRVIFDR